MTPLTASELEREWLYRFEERLGILCGAAEPTPRQRAIARREADEWRKEQEKLNESTAHHTDAPLPI